MRIAAPNVTLRSYLAGRGGGGLLPIVKHWTNGNDTKSRHIQSPVSPRPDCPRQQLLPCRQHLDAISYKVEMTGAALCLGRKKTPPPHPLHRTSSRTDKWCSAGNNGTSAISIKRKPVWRLDRGIAHLCHDRSHNTLMLTRCTKRNCHHSPYDATLTLTWLQQWLN